MAHSVNRTKAEARTQSGQRGPHTLTAQQRQALELLAKHPAGLDRKQLRELTGLDKGWAKTFGAHTKGFAGTQGPGLVGLGLVRYSGERQGGTYTITPEGRAALGLVETPEPAKEMVRTADSKGRVALPGFANATVLLEKIDDTEYRVRKARVIPEKDLHFHEEDFPLVLSERDALRFLEMLEHPPEPNAAARKAAKEFMRDYGHLADCEDQQYP